MTLRTESTGYRCYHIQQPPSFVSKKEQLGFTERVTIFTRYILSFMVLSIFLFLPTLWLKTNFALTVAKLPLWKKFAFFNAMFELIDEANKGQRNE